MTERLKKTRHPGIFETSSSYVVRYRDLSGRQRQKTCRTLDEARRFRAKVTLNPGAGSPRSGPTVSEYAEEWLSMLSAASGSVRSTRGGSESSRTTCAKRRRSGRRRGVRGRPSVASSPRCP